MSDADSTLQKLKGRGYWRVNFVPTFYRERLTTLRECREIVEKNSVSLRGWDYPHIPRGPNASDMRAGPNYYEGCSDWYRHIELWRMYQSGQFVHFAAVPSDWSEDGGWKLSSDGSYEGERSLNILGDAVYQLTEIFEFLSRLTKNDIYDDAVVVSISLHNTKGRKLVAPPDRHLWGELRTNLDTIQFEGRFSKEEVVTGSAGLALKAVEFLFERFNWQDIPMGAFKRDQERLLMHQQ